MRSNKATIYDSELVEANFISCLGGDQAILILLKEKGIEMNGSVRLSVLGELTWWRDPVEMCTHYHQRIMEEE